MSKLVECVPNFSEGRNLDIVEKIASEFRGKEGVKLLDYSSDKDHNRSVVTVIGAPDAVSAAMVNAAGVAVELIDLTKHKGEHPRMGAVDVIPFIPVRGMKMQECVALSKTVAKEIYDKYGLPSYLYENSASSEMRRNLADVRRGEFEGLAAKMQKPGWKPDFGDAPHPTAGAAAVSAREFLIAFNVNLGTSDLAIAVKISNVIRHSGGGLRFVKAMGVDLAERNIAQVSMNLTDYRRTSIYRVFELIKIEAARYGVPVIGSEVIGLLPMQALVDTAEYYLQIEGFKSSQIIEAGLLE
ncbi:MAG: glutamate formimidoyltransferase [Defluviitaleaceae bacterium]|nr:glutamate formimidoyltransferase [Defluviitaleaceae bacterium]MCL2836435.1 glutamate formimidoyltransferase [Defluviitaleaceae bacterium]